MMGYTMLIYRDKIRGRFFVHPLDPDGVPMIGFRSPKYKYLWVARFFGRRDVKRHIANAYSFKAVSNPMPTFIEEVKL